MHDLDQWEEIGRRRVGRCDAVWPRLPPRTRPDRPARPAAPPGVALLAAALLGVPGLASAAPPCTVSVTSTLAFGAYDVFAAAPLTSTGRIRLQCPPGGNLQITLSRGNSATFTWRELRSGAEVLRYNVYQDAAMSVIWGDGTGGSQPLVPPRFNTQLVLYGRIPAGQDPVPGAYTDTLVVTIFL